MDEKPYTAKRRDQVVVAVCNFLVNTFASPQYREFVGLSFRLGIKRLDEIKAQRDVDS